MGGVVMSKHNDRDDQNRANDSEQHDIDNESNLDKDHVVENENESKPTQNDKSEDLHNKIEVNEDSLTNENERQQDEQQVSTDNENGKEPEVEQLNEEKVSEDEINEEDDLADDDEEVVVYEEVSSFSAFKVVLVTLLTLLIIGGSIAAAGAYYVYTNLQPVDPDSEEFVQVTVPMGSSGTRIASILKEHDLIKNEQLFYYYVRYKGVTGFQAGDYFLSPSMGIDQIITNLQEGIVHVETERFTVIEGLTVEETAQSLADQGLVDYDEFLIAVNEADFSDIAFVNEIPEDENRKYRLEGFLYPETYEVYKGLTEEQIIRVMLEQFQKVFKSEWTEALDEHGLTMYEVVTLASIVEREAVLDEERKTISGVFHNRLNEEWLLQSCATVQFVLDKPRERLLLEDLEVDSPYNTYKNAGLPPSPIASPRASSIEAALFPEEHEYFFFVIKNDGSNGHNFARTYQEHLDNDARSRGNF